MQSQVLNDCSDTAHGGKSVGLVAKIREAQLASLGGLGGGQEFVSETTVFVGGKKKKR